MDLAVMDALESLVKEVVSVAYLVFIVDIIRIYIFVHILCTFLISLISPPYTLLLSNCLRYQTCQCQSWILLAVESQARDAARVRVAREVVMVDTAMEDTAVTSDILAPPRQVKNQEDTEVDLDHPRAVSQSQNDVDVIAREVRVVMEDMVVSFLAKQVTDHTTDMVLMAVESRVRDRQRAAARVRAARDRVTADGGDQFTEDMAAAREVVKETRDRVMVYMAVIVEIGICVSLSKCHCK